MSWLLGALRAQLVMVWVFVARFLVHANALRALVRSPALPTTICWQGSSLSLYHATCMEFPEHSFRRPPTN